jgi:DNA-binding MarR family transcriptional regulator
MASNVVPLNEVSEQEAQQPGLGTSAPAGAAQGTDVLCPAYDLRILRSLRRIIRCVDLYSKQLSVSNQITTPQLVCLLAVVNNGPLTATAISREVHLSASTVVGILDRLEEKGLIARIRDRNDRRVVQVSATGAGVALSRQAPSPLQKTLANALNTLPELEQATIALSLERIVALMEAQGIDASPILATGPINPTAA